MSLRFKVVIPARHASTRLPGKPLLDIAGKPMVVHVAEQRPHRIGQAVELYGCLVKVKFAEQDHHRRKAAPEECGQFFSCGCKVLQFF